MHYKYRDFFLFYRNGHLAILAVKVFWVKIIVASLYGNNQLAVAVKKSSGHNSNKRERVSVNNSKMKCVNLCGEN